MKAITVCVEYSDILDITLPLNSPHFEEILVVTSLEDEATKEVALRHGKVVHATNAFYDDGAYFNKWKALEQGLDVLGRTGMLCIMDADIVFPKSFFYPEYLKESEISLRYQQDCLYSPRRRILPIEALHSYYGEMREILIPDLSDYRMWENLPLYPDYEWAGYTQIFHANDKHLPEPPWHEQDWKHAGGADSMFQALWPQEYKKRTPWEVLHIGTPGMNWAGRVTPMLDGTVPKDASHRLHRFGEMMRSRSVNKNFNSEKLDPCIEPKKE